MLKFLTIITYIMLISTAELSTQTAKIDFEEFDLANGLHVILHKDNTNPIVSVDIWYHVGAKDEDPGRTGFAHLFEHMMFQGSGNVKKNRTLQLYSECRRHIERHNQPG